jgi:excisionase family DNA binding protein
MVLSESPGNLLTLREVSSLLHIHPNTLRRWCEEGKIPVVRVTSRGDRRFRREDIQHYLDQLNNENGQLPINI